MASFEAIVLAIVLIKLCLKSYDMYVSIICIHMYICTYMFVYMYFSTNFFFSYGIHVTLGSQKLMSLEFWQVLLTGKTELEPSDGPTVCDLSENQF